MQDSGSGWPLWPRWGTSLSSPDVTPATKLPSSLLRPRPEVAWLLAWDVPHPESNWAHLHSEVCTPPPQVYCPSRQVLFLSLFCWVTPNGSLFAAWAPSSSCGFPSYTLFSGGFYFQSTQYKTCPFGNSLGFFFFFSHDNIFSPFSLEGRCFRTHGTGRWPGHQLGSFVFWVPQSTGETGVGEGLQKPRGQPLWGHLQQKQSGSSSSSSRGPGGLLGHRVGSCSWFCKKVANPPKANPAAPWKLESPCRPGVPDEWRLSPERQTSPAKRVRRSLPTALEWQTTACLAVWETGLGKPRTHPGVWREDVPGLCPGPVGD